MIKRIYADNYKTYVNFTANFDSINVLLGRNGSGKSNLFDLIYKLKRFISNEQGLKELFTPDTLTHWQTLNTQTFELELEVQEHQYVYHLEIEYDLDNDKSRVCKEVLTCDGNANTLFFAKNGEAYLYNDFFEQRAELLINWGYSGVGFVQERNDNKLLTAFKKAMNKIIVCHLRPFFFEGYTDKESDIPDYHFSNFTSVLKFMLQSKPDKIQELLSELKEINPQFSKLSLMGNETIKALRITYDVNGTEVNYKLDELSDGEKSIIALYCLLICYKNEDAVLLLDEPENYITLSEIQPCLQLVEDFAENNAQCILISHHPEVLNYLATSYGIWFSRKEHGVTRITDTPKINEAITLAEYVQRGWDSE